MMKGKNTIDTKQFLYEKSTPECEKVAVPLSSLDKTDIDRLNLQGLSCVVGNRRQAKRLTQLALAAAERQQYPRGHA